jgi:hypothetical protein
MARKKGNHAAAGCNSYLTWRILLHTITDQKKISGRSLDRYRFVPTIIVYNEARDAVKRTRFFNSLFIKFKSPAANFVTAVAWEIKTFT